MTTKWVVYFDRSKDKYKYKRIEQELDMKGVSGKFVTFKNRNRAKEFAEEMNTGSQMIREIAESRRNDFE